MDIKGLDYNTRREKLVLPEYGREIQKMVDHALTIKNRQLRQQCAETIIATMKRMFPQNGSQEDKMQKLWDHLAIMSDFKLDIDYPVDISLAHNITEKPQPLKYDMHDVKVRHYGSLLFEVFERLKTMPEGRERDSLVQLAANQMKKSLATWGHGSNDNEKVADDLARFTDGKIQLDLSTFKFERISSSQQQNNNKKRKK